MLDTKTLTKETIKTCRESKKWLKDFVAKHAPKGTTFSCAELRVNDVEGDEYIFCEVVLTCKKRKHCFNFYAGKECCSLVERLGGKKGEEAISDTYGKAFDMDFDIPGMDDKGDLEDFLKRLDKYVPKMPKSAKKATKHIYLLTTKSLQENGHNGDDVEEDETIFETREKAQKSLAEKAKEALDLVDEVSELTIDDNDHTKESGLEAIKNGVDEFSLTGYIDGDYYEFGAEITEKDIF